MPASRLDFICPYCGSSKHYAKGYCRKCYTRLLRNGTVDFCEKVNFDGQIVNGHRITDDGPDTFLYTCLKCGKKRIRVRRYPPSIFRCKCSDEYISQETDRHKEIINAFVECNFDFAQTGRKLNLSRQRIHQIVKKYRKEVIK